MHAFGRNIEVNFKDNILAQAGTSYDLTLPLSFKERGNGFVIF
jgi:hypothetical protein